MEIQKTKGELLAFLESSGANSLIDFLGSSSSVNLAVADELDEIESSSSSSEVEETIEDGKETGRDDEDFIILMEPKNKKKMEKRAIGIVKSNVPKSKRKCEFCGTMETPMWRRGPTGKGTLCNACGVKWSLKFRKRAGKKASKVEKIRDDGNQQRQSTRKKLPSKKSSEEPADSMADSTLNEDSNSHTHIGLCCNHSKKRKEREDVEDGQDWKKRSTRDANQEYDSLSDDASPQSSQLFGKLLNVVEVQLVEEEELERIKAQIRLLRQDLEGQEASKEKELIQIKADSLEQLLRLKGDMVGIHVGNVHEKLVKDCSDGINSFMKSFRIQMDEAKKSFANSGYEAIQEGFARFESEAEQMAQTMAANFAQMSQKTSDDLLRIQTAFLNAEDSIKVKYATNHKDMKAIFTPLHDRMEIIEDPILKSH